MIKKCHSCSGGFFLGWGIGRGGSFSVTKNVIEMPLRTDSTKKAYAAFPSWTRKRGAKGRLEKDERGGGQRRNCLFPIPLPKIRQWIQECCWSWSADERRRVAFDVPLCPCRCRRTFQCLSRQTILEQTDSRCDFRRAFHSLTIRRLERCFRR